MLRTRGPVAVIVVLGILLPDGVSVEGQVRVEQPDAAGESAETRDLRLDPLFQSLEDNSGPQRAIAPPSLITPRALYPLAQTQPDARDLPRHEWFLSGPFAGGGRQMPGLTRFDYPPTWSQLPSTLRRTRESLPSSFSPWNRRGVLMGLGPYRTDTQSDSVWPGSPTRIVGPPSSAALERYEAEIIAASPLFGPTTVLPGSVSPLQPSSVKALARPLEPGKLLEATDAPDSPGSRPTATAGPAALAEEYAALAADHLRKGEFYRAVSYYDVALTVDWENGHRHLSQGHALLGAGEYFSALRRFERAFRLSPELARSDLDLNDLITDVELLQLRRADLETALQRREDHRFRFLLGYIEYYSGFRSVGRENLDRAANSAPPGSMIARFPNLLEAGGAIPDMPPQSPGMPPAPPPQ